MNAEFLQAREECMQFLQAEISEAYGIEANEDLLDCIAEMESMNDLVIAVFDCLAYLTDAHEAMEDAKDALESAFAGSWDEVSYSEILHGIEIRADALADSFIMTVQAILSSLKEARK